LTSNALWKQLLRSKRVLVEGNRVGGALNVDVGDDGVTVSIGTIVHKGFSCVRLGLPDVAKVHGPGRDLRLALK